VIPLFLKLYGVLIATLAISFMVQMQVMDYAWRQLAAGQNHHLRFRPAFHLIDETLRGIAPEHRAQRLQELSEGFGVPARIEPPAALAARHALSPAQRQALEAGAILSLDRKGGGYDMAKLSPVTGEVVALSFPGPGPRGIKMMIYAINWAVEFLLVAILVFFWVRPFWKDLLALQGAASAVGGGELEARVSVGRLSPLRPFAAAFNGMAARIALLVQSHRSLTSAISHELRTPLARLRFSHSMARDEPTAGGKDRLLGRMERDIAQIDELTSELLGYARLERDLPRLELASVPAHPWLEDVLADSDMGGPVTVTASIEARGLRCEPRYMARAVANLVRNARVHARSAVTVSVRHEAGRTVIDVDDDGVGIAEGDRERVFEPFVRLDHSRSRDSGGFGLGLAIARQVARWHGGDALVSDSPLGGARVSIVW